MFDLKSILTVPEEELVCCDYHPEFGIAYIIKQRGRCLLVVNGIKWREWDDPAEAGIWNMRISGKERVLAWNVPGGIAAISPTEWKLIPVGGASNVQVSSNYIFMAYSEDSTSIATLDQLESNIVSVFSKSGELILSVNEKLKNLSYDGTFMEVSHACVAREDVFFFLAYQTPHIWILDAAGGTLKPILTTDVDDVIALSASHEAIYLLERRDNKCVVRSFDRSNYSTRQYEMDQGKCSTLLDRAAKFKPIFGVQGGSFLTVGDGMAELLTLNLEGRSSRAS